MSNAFGSPLMTPQLTSVTSQLIGWLQTSAVTGSLTLRIRATGVTGCIDGARGVVAVDAPDIGVPQQFSQLHGCSLILADEFTGIDQAASPVERRSLPLHPQRRFSYPSVPSSVVTEETSSESVKTQRVMLSKVPEVTLWFWVIKILCTTVGESFADWINMTLGVGLNATALIFTVVLAVILGYQLSLNRYVAFVYWLTVVVLSVTGTLYTDILTDDLGVPLAVSTSVFAAILAIVFGVWYAREGTLSIHSIVTTPRELFYWLAVLVTFALGTAVGDWTLQLTGWGPGTSVLLPAGLIALIVIGWRLGANAVLSFWLAYVLTRPLGANLGDWFTSPSGDHGLGLGTAVTSAIFLTAILVTVVYLTRTRTDVIDNPERTHAQAVTTGAARERIMLAYYALVAVAAGALLAWAGWQQHATAAQEEESSAAPVTTTLTPGQAKANFPPAEIAKFRTIVQDTLAKVATGDQTGATARIKDLETAWDDEQATLQPMDETAWRVLDGRIDSVLDALRASTPDPGTESRTLTALFDRPSVRQVVQRVNMILRGRRRGLNVLGAVARCADVRPRRAGIRRGTGCFGVRAFTFRHHMFDLGL